ncbi:MAG: tRNA 2-selenouridine(34) synthase MnmH [Thiobacillaceae bacterium]|nr:tRNA 2-selenouridine(34) synthase MnmH [Thiobacillaceae bacterium]
MQCASPAAAARKSGVATLDQLDAYDELIDARSPAEYAEDHIPGAVNLPVLDDAERARVGTLYKQHSPFMAKKVGAALVARNIARHLETHLADRPRDYRPLVYCWRGGNRSGAMVTVLRAVGWDAAQLEGGYKAYRRAVVAELDTLPQRLRFVVVCGRTGVGKSRFLRALERAGAQVLDLERLAAHMGSVLGAYPHTAQPTQKHFESLLWHALRRFDPARPVFAESESKKIGRLHMPEALLQRLRASLCLTLEAALPLRIALLKADYPHFLADPAALARQLDCLTRLQGHDRVSRWKALAAAGDWDGLVAELLHSHYDPAYARSLGRNYPQAADGPCFELTDVGETAFDALARAARAHFDPPL